MQDTDKVMISFLADKEVHEKIVDLQKETTTFSRSEMIRKLLDLGIKSIDKDGQAS